MISPPTWFPRKLALRAPQPPGEYSPPRWPWRPWRRGSWPNEWKHYPLSSSPLTSRHTLGLRALCRQTTWSDSMDQWPAPAAFLARTLGEGGGGLVCTGLSHDDGLSMSSSVCWTVLVFVRILVCCLSVGVSECWTVSVAKRIALLEKYIKSCKETVFSDGFKKT